MSTTSLVSDLLSALSLRRRRTRESIKTKLRRRSSYTPYTVYQQIMSPSILRDAEATNRLLEAILDSSGGRRSLSRLSRTCKAFSKPALDVLWRELDSLVPLIGLFPAHLFKRSRKPGLGLVSTLLTVLERKLD
jgi:hypothetical protein